MFGAYCARDRAMMTALAICGARWGAQASLDRSNSSNEGWQKRKPRQKAEAGLVHKVGERG
jgi:hypothetical protein